MRTNFRRRPGAGPAGRPPQTGLTSESTRYAAGRAVPGRGAGPGIGSHQTTGTKVHVSPDRAIDSHPATRRHAPLPSVTRRLSEALRA